MLASSKTVLYNNRSDLLHLVRLRVPSLRLQIQNLVDISPREDVVTPFDAFGKAHAAEQVSELVERDGRIGSAPENACKQLIGFRHDDSLAECATAA
jgi:hypothetical protein